MGIHCGHSRPIKIPDKDRGWQYSRPLGTRAVELGTAFGFDVGLPVHFHDEDQITFVLAGTRRFIINDELVKIETMQGTCIPAGVPHRSLAEESELFCVNVYTMPGECRSDDLFSNLGALLRRRGALNWPDLITLVEQHIHSARPSPTQLPIQPARLEVSHPVSQAARLSGMSREAFSRRFRKAHRVPAQTFHVIEKLNAARRALRTADSIADIAAETGFSDQSHLGRLFRRTFGVTPGQYRRG